VAKLAKKLAAYNWDEAELEKEILLHCSSDKEILKEVEMRDLNEITDIKKTMTKMDKIQKKYDHVNAVKDDWIQVQSRRNKTQSGMKGCETTLNNNKRSPQPTVRNFEAEDLQFGRRIESRRCWSCNLMGHISRNCSKRLPVTCHACGTQGHIRKNCPNLKCNRCAANGHRSEECYTNMTRRHLANNQRETRRPDVTATVGRTWNNNNSNRGENRQMPTQNRPKQPRYYEETDYERGVRRGKEIAAMEMEDGECGDFEQGTPNERGPTVEESVGALQ